MRLNKQNEGTVLSCGGPKYEGRLSFSPFSPLPSSYLSQSHLQVRYVLLHQANSTSFGRSRSLSPQTTLRPPSASGASARLPANCNHVSPTDRPNERRPTERAATDRPTDRPQPPPSARPNSVCPSVSLPHDHQCQLYPLFLLLSLPLYRQEFFSSFVSSSHSSFLYRE